MQTPVETRYARSGEVHIAYQTVGSGSDDYPWGRTPEEYETLMRVADAAGVEESVGYRFNLLSLLAAARGALFGPIPVAQVRDAVPRVEAVSECGPIRLKDARQHALRETRHE